MIRTWGALSPEIRAFLYEERGDAELSAAARARALARARAALAAGVMAPPVSSTRAGLPSRLTVSALLACVACAAALVAAYDVRAYVTRGDAPVAAPRAPTPDQLVSPTNVPGTLAMFGDEPSRTRPRVLPPPRSSLAGALGAELRLLEGARAAIARERFAAALLPLAEHARRFPEGQLAEEREALRVNALLGLGRSGDARRAAVAFRVRFPHSLLSRAVDQMSAESRH